MNIEWNEIKAKNNIEKHNVSFEEAVTVLSHHLSITFFDEDIYDEPREITIGYSYKNNILLVVHIQKDEDTIRIISARKATKKEKNFYEKGI